MLGRLDGCTLKNKYYIQLCHFIHNDTIWLLLFFLVFNHPNFLEVFFNTELTGRFSPKKLVLKNMPKLRNFFLIVYVYAELLLIFEVVIMKKWLVKGTNSSHISMFVLIFLKLDVLILYQIPYFYLKINFYDLTPKSIRLYQASCTYFLLRKTRYTL